MTEMLRIVAATDLSAPARHAAERAALISRETGAALDLLHVADVGVLRRMRDRIAEMPSGLEARVLEAASQRLHQLGDALHETYSVSAAAHVVDGSLVAELAKYATASGADLLVCGAKGESFLRHWVLGTTALRLLSLSTHPVLVVKQPPRVPYSIVLVAVDFSPYSLAAVQTARRVAPKAHLVLFHAFELPFEGAMRYAQVEEASIQPYRKAAREAALGNLTALRQRAGLSALEATVQVRHGNPTLRIVEQEQALDCDLIVMGKHGEGFVQELLLGGVTKRVLSECSGDVLVSTQKAD